MKIGKIKNISQSRKQNFQAVVAVHRYTPKDFTKVFTDTEFIPQKGIDADGNFGAYFFTRIDDGGLLKYFKKKFSKILDNYSLKIIPNIDAKRNVDRIEI